MLPASALPVIVGVLSFVVAEEVVSDVGAIGGIESKEELLGVEGNSSFSRIAVAPENIFEKSVPLLTSHLLIFWLKEDAP